MSFLVSEPIAAYRVLPLLVVDATSGSPSSTAIDKTNVWIHKYGGSWVNPTNDPVAVSGQTGAWELQLTQSELDTPGTLGWYLSATGIRTEISWESILTSAPVPDYYQNEASDRARILPIVLVDDTTGDISSATITSSNIQLHKYGGSWVDSTNAPVAATGKTGAWQLTLTQAELDTIGPMGWRVVDVADNVRTQVGWAAIRGAAEAVIVTPVSSVVSPIPTSSSSYVDHVAAAIARLPLQFRSTP